MNTADAAWPRRRRPVGQALLGDLGVQLAAFEQLRVRAARRDPPVLEHDDVVGQGDRREPVGDHERRAAGHHLAQRGWSALETGLAFLPLVMGIAAGAKAASRVISRTGSRNLAALGLVLVAGGAGLLALAPDVAGYPSDILPAFLVLGFDVGLVFPAGSIAAMSDVPDEAAGLASGLVTTGHELGAAFGVAAISAVATAASTFATGYEAGFVAVAAVAGLVAGAAILAGQSARAGTEVRAGARG